MVLGMLPIHRALVGSALVWSFWSGEEIMLVAVWDGMVTEAPGGPGAEGGGADDMGAMGVVERGVGPLVKTRPGGAGATVLTEGPLGAESILPKPMRTGAVSERAET